MKYLYIIDHSYHYEMENICRLFFYNEKIIKKFEFDSQRRDIVTILKKRETEIIIEVEVNLCGASRKGEKSYPLTALEDKYELELGMASILFDLLSELTGIRPEWGILTGIRPVKMMRKLVGQMKSEEEAKEFFRKKLKVTDKKTNLLSKIEKEEREAEASSKPNSVSLYVSIPFCPTRCSYCSFVSHSIEKAGSLIPDYIERLREELIDISGLIKGVGLKLETVYIGGGTPTSLSETQLEAVLQTLNKHFDMSEVREFTVEAGRPDTVTAAKLEIIKGGGVSRISINPQTLNEDVLKAIGRNHTVKQIYEAYDSARNHGFKNINMDVIAGLPLDDYNSFQRTIDGIIKLRPENITVHTLALKTSASIKADVSEAGAKPGNITNYLDYAYESLNKSDYLPYYMYKQSKSADNLENVGWQIENNKCLYNIFMMDEIHTVLAAGAGAVSKLKDPRGEYLERIFNYKYPYEYIKQFDKILDRKKRVIDFYNERNI